MSSNWLSSVSSDPTGLTTALQNAQTQRSQYAQYAIAQATTAYADGNTELAITNFKRAIALDSSNTTAYNYLGQIYLSDGDTENAIKAYKELVRIQSNYQTADDSSDAPTEAEARIKLGNAYLQAEQYNLSEEQFKKAERLDSTDPVAFYTLGQQYLTQGRLSEALSQIEQAKKLSPNDGNVYYALGSIYNAQGEYMDAVDALRTAVSLKSDFAAANYELGVAYNALGYTEGAQEQLAILEELDTDLADDLSYAMNPQMLSIDAYSSLNSFNAGLGRTPLWALNPALIEPDSTATESVVIQFSTDMDYASITNVANWTISRGDNTISGLYNSGIPISEDDAKLPTMPVMVTYDPTTYQAIVKFRLTQNSEGDAIIDPKHIVFTFNGTSASGKYMDPNANSIDGQTSLIEGDSVGFSSVDYYA